MARNRASMREGPLAELFRATEAAQRGAEPEQEAPKKPHEDEATGRRDEASRLGLGTEPGFEREREPSPNATATTPPPRAGSSRCRTGPRESSAAGTAFPTSR